ADSSLTLPTASFAPNLRIRQICPAECVFARAMRNQMIESRFRFLQRRDVTRLDPPHRNGWLFGRLEELVLSRIDVAMGRLEHKSCKRFVALPDREVDRPCRITRPSESDGTLAALVLQPPDETRRPLGERVDAREIVEEV